MNATLVKALLALVPVVMLFTGAAVVFCKSKTTASLLQLLGAGCLVLVILAHVCEALRAFPAMHWGEEHSIGHYIDLGSAGLGLTLFSIGYLLHSLSRNTG
jgi:hypothetical protein